MLASAYIWKPKSTVGYKTENLYDRVGQGCEAYRVGQDKGAKPQGMVG